MSKFDVRGNGCETYRHGKCCGNCAHFSDQSGRSILTEQRCKKWGDYFCMIFGLCNEWTPHENIAEEMIKVPKRPRQAAAPRSPRRGGTLAFSRQRSRW